MLKSYIAFDLETTGLNPEQNEIIEIGALKVREGKVAERFMEFIRPTGQISPEVEELTGITNEMVEGAGTRSEIIPRFIEFCGEDILIGHNISFDYSFMKISALAEGLQFEKSGIDTLRIARKVHKNMESKSLGSLCSYYQIENQSAHRAYHDALATAKLYQTLAHYFEPREPRLFCPMQLNYKQKKSAPATQKQIQFLQKLIRGQKLDLEWEPGKITRSEASKMIDDLLNGHIAR
ncbi:3'-5' exonuclease [Luxibacter massiliensis]|uniref:3'-5' exonuclease n=1 Tax=Luxibacter massiliensis TaxID=2219695 RepID=UPI000F066D94|nr:3'-5' exonuclease [Luxibacter massiliensis]